ncbi:hypothetical protein DFP72DRAFT_1076640 [Ephemerocybe angulata]|uniref:Uncharacterized protein n=1 Tax=Ephemerocybe angulata TaxID=980116 RepID=A0A8H6HGS3_9AGAR|nr:hypothetical protein DFP72DRAFT_1076640 [Tulosesus angulatus]
MAVFSQLSSPAFPVFHIPQELIDHIIDDLKDDFVSLKSVGLVGIKWHRRTRRHLFHTVRLDGEDPTCRLRTLLDLLHKHSDLAKHIKHLSLLQPGRSSRLLQSSELVKLLPLLGSLATLEIIGSDVLFPIDWSRFTFNLQTALYDRMAAPSLTDLVLCNIRNMEIIPLAQYHNIQSLEIAAVYETCPGAHFSGAWLPLNQRPRSASSENMHLKKLHVTGSGGFLKTLLCCASTGECTLGISRIKKLEATAILWDDDMQKAWSMLLDTCASSVKVYTLVEDCRSNPMAPTPPGLLSLSRFDQLQQFKLLTTYSRFRNDEGFPLLLRGLDQLTRSGNPVNLRTIELHFLANPRDLTGPLMVLDIYDVVLCCSFWKELDSILSCTTFSGLEAINIVFYTTGCSDLENSQTLANRLLLARMPQLNKRNIVQSKLVNGTQRQ